MLQSSRPRCEKSRLNRRVLRRVIAPSYLVEFGAFIFDMRVSATVRQEWEGLCTFYFTVWFGRAWWRSQGCSTSAWSQVGTLGRNLKNEAQRKQLAQQERR